MLAHSTAEGSKTVTAANMFRASFVCIAVAAACFVQVCQSQDVQVNGQSVQSRILGSLNRYYLHSWDADAKIIVYKELERDLAAFNEGEGGTPEETPEEIPEETPKVEQKVAIVIHGRNSAAFSEFTNALVNSFINNDNSMLVVVVDWSLVAGLDYTTSFNSVSFVANDIISLIGRLETEISLDKNLLHIVGFDVGAHIAGIVSRHSRVGAKKVTGLSPAAEKWDASFLRLSERDAELVEAIHSDYVGVRALGIALQVGTIDLYLNTGTAQPGCANNQCNHDRAWQVFAANLDSGGHLAGLRCATLADMTRNNCTGFPAVMLGTNALEKAGEGIYRINTGRVYPYNL